MLKRLKNTFILHINNLLQISAIITGAWLVGVILYAIVYAVDSSKTKTYINIGFLLAMTIGIMTVIIVDMVFYAINFNIAVSMGSSRKHFLIDSTLVLLGENIIFAALIFVLGKIELFASKFFYGNINLDRDAVMVDFKVLATMAGAAVAVLAVSLFIGALLQRFGKTAFWIMWGIYMACALGGAGFASAAKSSDGVMGKLINSIAQALSNISAAGGLTICAVLCIILAGVGVLLFRRAPIK